MELTLLLIIAALLVVQLVLTLTRNNRSQSEEMQRALRQQMQENREELNRSIRELRMEMTQTLNQGLQQLQDAMHKNMMTTGELQRQKFDAMARQQETLIQSTEKRLDDMRVMVEEKLQKTLNERIGQSFEIVRSQLENVQKGLGEMKSLAQDVGGLKKVLSNVKMRGTFGEVQLGALLEQMMSPEQYEANVKTKKSGTEFVEFAIKLPGKDDANSTIYLPIDAKFPKDVYEQYYDAFEAGDAVLMESCGVRVLGNKTIVTNGDQTDTVYQGMDHQMTFEQSLRSREFEPDAPNYTPRISGIMHIENSGYNYAMSAYAYLQR